MARFNKIQVLTAIAETGMIPVFYHQDMEITKLVVKAGCVGGPSFVQNIKAPMQWTMIMATGAVEPEEANLSAWFKAGVTCVGMGSKLFPKEAIAQKDWATITNLCRNALAICKNHIPFNPK